MQVKSLDFIFDEEDDKRRGEDKSSLLLSKTGCLFFDHVQTYLQLNTSKAFQRCVRREHKNTASNRLRLDTTQYISITIHHHHRHPNK